MANTIDTYWDVDGVSLNTLARNIETDEGLMAPPPLRGSNVVIPHRVGTQRVSKTVDERVLNLKMWVRATDDDGAYPAGRKAQRALYESNMRALRQLLWRSGEPIQLRKRFYVDGVLRTAVATAEFDGGMDPSKIGHGLGKFTVDLRLADPYFYDEAYTTIALGAADVTTVVPGDGRTNKILINAIGSRNSPIVNNRTLGVVTQFNQDIPAGASLQIDVEKYKALYTPPGGTQTTMNSKALHTGDPSWMVLKPGPNTLRLTSTGAGLGAVNLQYKAAWL